MEKKNVAAFFDRCASWWDADMIRNEPIIATILDNAGVKAGTDVLYPNPERAAMYAERFEEYKRCAGVLGAVYGL